MLNDGRTGAPLALIDGPTLTVRRTAAASALAADYLARKDSEHLLMAGTGALAPHLIEAHCAMRPIRRISIWGRRREKAEEVAAGVKQPNVEVQVVDDLEKTVPLADIISCATSPQPRWCKEPGCSQGNTSTSSVPSSGNEGKR